MIKASTFFIINMVVLISANVGIAFATMSEINNPNNFTGAQTRIIHHSMGETEISGTPDRIVALDWSASENLFAMGVQPIAVSDLDGMKKYLRPEGLSPNIVDVGLPEAPNLETILGLKPDLILGEKLSHSELYDELSSIAPTIIYDNSPPLNSTLPHLEALEQNIMLIADAINLQDIGVQIVDGLHAKYEEAADKIEAAGLNGTKYVAGAVDPPYGDYSFSTLRFFDNSFFMSQMLSRIGLVNAVTEDYGLANWGMRQVGLEGLATVDGPDVHFFYIHAEGQNAFQNEWKDNPVWSNLEMARNGNMHPLGPLYVYGGPKQMEEMVDKVVAALTGVTDEQLQQQEPLSSNQTTAVS
jgi:ferric hydroxamate transport system substrate-binding protein